MVLLENFGGLVIQHIELLKLVLLSRSVISTFSYNYSKALNSFLELQFPIIYRCMIFCSLSLIFKPWKYSKYQALIIGQV